MNYGFIKFKTLPSIGFAHHFFTDKDDYSHRYGNKNSIEIVYVNSGGFDMTVNGETICAPEGSVIVLFRALPITLSATGGKAHSHSTVQFETQSPLMHLSSPTDIPSGGALLPFVLMPCADAESIKKEIYSVISELGENKRQNMFSASLKLVAVIRILDECSRQSLNKTASANSLISYKVKKYIGENLSSHISLKDLSRELGKSPNYINSVFKNENGITIIQYVNRRKMTKIGELITRKNLTFKDACKAVGVDNVQYGSKMFEKHMGIGHNRFADGDIHRNK